ncbi:hypothetical protein [Aegicerativicinus sediminis]|nr:hypothetical protein [Aegicerativicinus sediminis]
MDQEKPKELDHKADVRVHHGQPPRERLLPVYHLPDGALFQKYQEM